MPAIAEADLVLDVLPARTDIQPGAPIRTLFIMNRDTGGHTLRVILTADGQQHNQWLLRPGEHRELLKEETSYRSTLGLWYTKHVRVEAAVAAETITAWDYELTTWDKGAMGQERYQ